MRSFSSVLLRLALGLSFISAVADRFSWWGAFGRPNVAWGSFARFEAYTAKLNWFMPQAMIPTLAVLSTCVELLLGLLLVVGWHTRIAAACGGLVHGDDRGAGTRGAAQLLRLLGGWRKSAPRNLFVISLQRGRVARAGRNAIRKAIADPRDVVSGREPRSTRARRWAVIGTRYRKEWLFVGPMARSWVGCSA